LSPDVPIRRGVSVSVSALSLVVLTGYVGQISLMQSVPAA
jgi:hypothetical protein